MNAFPRIAFMVLKRGKQPAVLPSYDVYEPQPSWPNNLKGTVVAAYLMVINTSLIGLEAHLTRGKPVLPSIKNLANYPELEKS